MKGRHEKLTDLLENTSSTIFTLKKKTVWSRHAMMGFCRVLSAFLLRLTILLQRHLKDSHMSLVCTCKSCCLRFVDSKCSCF